MPMLDARGDEHDIARMQLPGFLAPELAPAPTIRAQQDLAAALVGMMDMPVVATARLKGHVCQEDRLLGVGQRIEKRLADEILRERVVGLSQAKQGDRPSCLR